MLATYDGPKASEKDRYRFLVSDTDMQNPLLYDDEIEFVLEEYSNHYERMFILYTNMLNNFIKRGDVKLGPQSENYNNSVNNLIKLVDKYEKLSNTSMAAPKLLNKSPRIFSKGMHDNA